MNFLKKLALYLLLFIALCIPLFAQVVDIPDPNLRAAIADALGIPHGTPITQEDMNRLTDLDVRDQGIANLTGLEFATNLTFLQLQSNRIEDISPLANLIQLAELHLGGNRIEDIGPLANLTQLTVLRLNENFRIEDISSLANLTHLRKADLDRNQIVDVRPLARLANLESLDLRDNRIIDVSPLANLTQLTELRMDGNQIEDISPLANLTNLVALWLNDNRITDVTALVNLTQLTQLLLSNNRIVDVSSLDGLPLIEFLYDESCELPPFPVRDRINNRDYPSIVSRWSGPEGPVRNRPELTGIENLASHDLWFSTPMFGLHFEYGPDEIRLVGDIDDAIQRREEYLAINPNMVFLVQVRMRSGGDLSYLPEDSPYWIRDAQGNIIQEELIDFTHPYIQDRVVQQALEVSKCGLFDGIFFDWWNEHRPVLADRFGDWSHKFRGNEAEQRARDNILRRIRAETHPNFLIMGNTNLRIIPRTGPYVNGGFMETGIPEGSTGAGLELVVNAAENSLLWLENNLRQPRINSLEGFSIPGEPLDSPNNLRWMRALTTLSLTHSDGYVLYSESGIFTHYWYDFWDADLGRPVGEKAQLYNEDIPGLYIREFTNGWAVYNHSGEAQVITLPEEAQGVASGLVNTEHALPNLDGEMYLRVKPKNPADVNGDGVVNILDLTLVVQGFGTDNPDADVNADGVVNVFDLVFIADQF